MFFLVLTGFTLALITVVFFRPDFLLNSNVLHLVAAQLEKKDIYLNWNTLNIQVDQDMTISFTKRQIYIESTDFCFESKNQFKGCAGRVYLAFTLGFSDFRPKVTRRGPVEIENLVWQTSGKNGERHFGTLNLESQDGLAITRVRGKVQFPNQDLLSLDAWVHLAGLKEGVKPGFKKDWDSDYLIKVEFRTGKTLIAGEIEGEGGSDRLFGRLSAQANQWIEGVPQLQISRCGWNWQRVGVREGFFDLFCPGVVNTTFALRTLKLPNVGGGVVAAQLKTSGFPLVPASLYDLRFWGPVEFVLNTIRTPVLEMNGHLRAELDGNVNTDPAKWKFKSATELNVRVPSFEKLVAQLRTSEWAVPAPINQLEGSLLVQAKAKFDDFSHGEVPFTIQTRLDSRTQKLDLDGDGVFLLQATPNEPSPRLTVNLALSQVKLELPRLNWAAPPPIFPDKRFVQKGPARRKTEPSFKYTLNIYTLPNRPAQVMSNLATTPVPVEVDLTLTESAPVTGQIRIQSFPVEVLRRKAKIEYFLVQLTEDGASSPVDGEIKIEYTDYTIQVKVYSTLKQPRFHLTSTPPLPENQLIAALLFDRPLEELETNETLSVGQARAAFAEGAINLVSFYALTSTPVQSVGYDPLTRSFSAKIRLGEGTSLTIGTIEGGAHLGIRKRLSQFWTVETSIQQSSSGGEVASAYLEWSHRY